MNWKPTDSLFVEWSDETAEPRSVQEVQGMIDQMRAIAREFGFDLSTFGNEDSTRKYLNDTQKIIDRANKVLGEEPDESV